MYVGGIGVGATEPDLHAAFARVGVHLAQVELVINRATGHLRGFAFVAIADDDITDDADSPVPGQASASRDGVLARMRLAHVDDRTLTVQPIAHELTLRP